MIKNEGAKYRVENKFFQTLKEARRYRASIKAGLPGDAVVTIRKAEKIGLYEVMWVPYA